MQLVLRAHGFVTASYAQSLNRLNCERRGRRMSRMHQFLRHLRSNGKDKNNPKYLPDLDMEFWASVEPAKLPRRYFIQLAHDIMITSRRRLHDASRLVHYTTQVPVWTVSCQQSTNKYGKTLTTECKIISSFHKRTLRFLNNLNRFCLVDVSILIFWFHTSF